MKKLTILAAVLLAVGLSACTQPQQSQADASTSLQTAPDHVHQPFEGDNIIPHELVGYCGNTGLTVHSELDEPWEKTIEGTLAISVTELVTYLDYEDEPCSCEAEYTVTTETNEDYEINLTEGFVRHGEKQVQLTREQVTELRATLVQIREAGDGERLP